MANKKPLRSPKCKICGAEGAGTLFPLFMLAAGYKFGEICDTCNEGA